MMGCNRLAVIPFSGRRPAARNPADWPNIPVDQARVVHGGSPFVTLNGQAVGATQKHGAGLVVVVGFGTRFTGINMGVAGDVVSEDDLRQVFEFQFKMLREIVEPASGPQILR